MLPASCMILSEALLSYINNEWKAICLSEDLVQFPGIELCLYPQKPTLFPSASPLQEPDLRTLMVVGNPNSFGICRGGKAERKNFRRGGRRNVSGIDKAHRGMIRSR